MSTTFEQKMKYDISEVEFSPTLRLNELFPDLGRNKAIWETPLDNLESKRQLILLWIIWMHDVNTPLSAYSTLQERRVVVKKKLGFITSPEWYTKMERYENPSINKMVIGFLKQEYNISYAELKTYEIAHTLLLEQILVSPATNSITTIKNLKTEIDACKNQILGQIHSAKLEKELEKAVIEENIMLDYNDLIEVYGKGEEVHSKYSI